VALPIVVSDPAAVDRFWAKVVQSGDCWTWTACLNPDGYGQFWVSGRAVKAHRFAYEQMVGEIPAGLELDHLCRNRSCVNPDHMDAVTHKVNVLRGVGVTAMHALKTECPQGHPLSGANLYPLPGGRTCRECKKASNRAWMRASRLSELAVAV